MKERKMERGLILGSWPRDFHSAKGWVVSPWNSHGAVLPPEPCPMTVHGCRVVRRSLRWGEAFGMDPDTIQLCPHPKRRPRHRHTQSGTTHGHREKMLSTSQAEICRERSVQPKPWSQTSSFHTVESKFCPWSHPVWYLVMPAIDQIKWHQQTLPRHSRYGQEMCFCCSSESQCVSLSLSQAHSAYKTHISYILPQRTPSSSPAIKVEKQALASAGVWGLLGPALCTLHFRVNFRGFQLFFFVLEIKPRVLCVGSAPGFAAGNHPVL